MGRSIPDAILADNCEVVSFPKFNLEIIHFEILILFMKLSELVSTDGGLKAASNFSHSPAMSPPFGSPLAL